MKSWHPDQFGDRVRSASYRGGINYDEKDESGFIRCKKCGYIMDMTKHVRGKGAAVLFRDKSYNLIGIGWGHQTWGTSKWGGDGVRVYYADPVVEEQGGCPFCGTYNYV